jgi:hypothetical protein
MIMHTKMFSSFRATVWPHFSHFEGQDIRQSLATCKEHDSGIYSSVARLQRFPSSALKNLCGILDKRLDWRAPTNRYASTTWTTDHTWPVRAMNSGLQSEMPAITLLRVETRGLGRIRS